MYIETVPNHKSRPSYLLRDAKRVGKKIVKRTIANLSKLPDEAIEALRLILKGVPLCDASKAFVVKSTLPCGHVHAIHTAMKRLRLAELISAKPCKERDIILALITQRLIEPCSKLQSVKQLHDTTVGAEFGLSPDMDENAIYGAMDWLIKRQAHIEKKLAAKHLSNGAMAFYDLSSSSYHGTHCELAKRGYNRDGLKLPAVEYGLLTDQEGRPISVQVYAGNTADPNTVPDQVQKLQKSFGLERVVFVGDRGMLTGARIKEIRENGRLGWISCLRSGDVDKLLTDADPSGAPLFSQENLAEISHPDFPGERLIACFNPLLKEDRTRTRNELLMATENLLSKLQMAAARRKRSPWSDAELGEKIGLRIGQHKMAKHFVIEVGGGNFTFHRNEDSIRREERLDGVYVIRTSESAERLPAADAVRAYKALGNVEKSFRTFKGVDILVRPIRHWVSDRVRTHIFLCMLTYYVEWHMRRALSPLLYVEDDLPGARAVRNPVMKAEATTEAMRKKRTKRSTTGFDLQNWRGILAALSTQCSTTVEANKIPFTMDTEPNAYQKEVFRLLNAISPLWNSVPSKRSGVSAEENV